MSKVMIIAGEVSGDMRAAELVSAVQLLRPDITWFGMGGHRMRAAGVETRFDVEDLAVIGFVEVIRRFSFFRRVFNEMLDWAEEQRPDAVLLVDYPGFNLRLARRLHAKGIKTIFYVCPQVWAWHRSRIPQMAVDLDHLMTIFPFEAECFKETDLPVTFVGHPLVDGVQQQLQHPPLSLPWKDSPESSRVAMLPGSRQSEIRELLPVMLGAARKLEQDNPALHFAVVAAGSDQADLIRSLCRNHALPQRLDIVTETTVDVVRQAQGTMVCSGTATLEVGLVGCPMVVLYRLNALSYWILKRMTGLQWIGMVNIVAGREICPELIQWQATETRLAEAMQPLLDVTDQRQHMLNDLAAFRQLMGEGGAAVRAAKVLLENLT